LHAVQRRVGREAKFRGTPLEQVDPELLEVEQAWNDVWEQEQLRRAVEDLRQELGTTKTFRAFEMYVILDLPPQEVSRRLALHIDNVYRAKESVTRMLREGSTPFELRTNESAAAAVQRHGGIRFSSVRAHPMDSARSD
jgi:DNA-directed RNA polymerase specialized sigma24 family protein